ncbi:MAG: TetR/AcrR family transcriptional regulator [Chloroflexota bacterium]
MRTPEGRTAGGRAGRPPATDHDAIALVAFELFRERGYDDVTMEEIAAAVGIGRTTLWRYFPTKHSLLWVHQDVYAREYQEALAARPPDEDLAIGAFRAYRTLGKLHPEWGESARQMIRAAEATPSTSTGKWDEFSEWGEFTAVFVASRRGGSPADAGNKALGFAIWSAIWAAGVVWALSDDVDETSAMDEALRAIVPDAPSLRTWD